MNNQLFIRPKRAPSSMGVDLRLLRKMAAALLDKETISGMMRGETFVPNTGMQGLISCSCGEKVVRDRTFQFSNGFLTSSLIWHWLSYHCSEIPSDLRIEIGKFKYTKGSTSKAQALCEGMN